MTDAIAYGLAIAFLSPLAIPVLWVIGCVILIAVDIVVDAVKFFRGGL